MTQSPSFQTVMHDPQWLAHRYDPGHDAFHLRHVSRARRAAMPFLTDEYLGSDKPLILRRVDAVEHAPAASPIHFIFHSAYYCSTLLAAAFDIPGTSMGLKEPVLLNDLVGWRHRGGGGAQVARVMDEGLRLLARPFSAGEATIVKPSNIVNPLIPAIMAMRPDARALFLYAPLEAYLASIARKGMWGRLWVRDLFGKLLREGMLGALGIAPEAFLGLTDLQVAAAGWLAQQQQFQSLADTLKQRVATLDSETFVDRPYDTLDALGQFFEFELDPSAITAIINGPVFGRDAKNGDAFAPGKRAADARSGVALHAEELEKVVVWAHHVADSAGICVALPQPLIR